MLRIKPRFCSRFQEKWPKSLTRQGLRAKVPQAYPVRYAEDTFVSITQYWQGFRDILPKSYCKFWVKLGRNGQAATEMAIFGSLIFVCFGVLLSDAHNFTEQQALQQQAFRMALRHYEDNAFISYNIIKDYNTPNLGGAFRQGNRGSVSAGNSVSWYIGEPENRSYYQINENLQEIARHKKKPKEGEDVDTPDEVWNIETGSETDYSATDLKQEDSLKIRTTRSSSNKDKITTTLKTRYQAEEDGDYSNGADVAVNQGLGQDGRYSIDSNGAVVEKSRSWETEH